MTQHLIPPHGGRLVDLMVDEARNEEIRSSSRDWASWNLTARQLCDLELLIGGGFSPLRGFLTRPDYDRVCAEMRLADGTLWPIPVMLDVSGEFASGIDIGSTIALRDPEGVMIAALHVEDVWTPDRTAEATAVFGTDDPAHPGVAYLLERGGTAYIGGRVEGVHPAVHYDFRHLRHTPAELRARFAKLGWRKVVAFQTRNPMHRAHQELTMRAAKEVEANLLIHPAVHYDFRHLRHSAAELRERFTKLGWRKVVAFQTRNPMHRAHQELTLRAAKEVEANLLIHPVVGMTQPGDLDHYTRVRCYTELLGRYPQQTSMLSLLPLAMRMAGPREALWHAIIRKNYGCTHFIVGRDHAGPGNDRNGDRFYGPYDAQELYREHEQELGVTMVPFQMLVYVEHRDAYVPLDEVPEGETALSISGTELRERLADGREIPEWFTFPEVARELQRRHPPRHRQGFTVFFTGLSGAGKSTVANALMVKFLEAGGRPVTLLDGDLVRQNLSSELGFSKEHRDINIRRIGYVASEITKNGGIAICAPIAPYDRVRREVREMIAPLGGFILVHVATSIDVCEERDRKGLYAKARAGIIKEFTGISDPYEDPTDADVVIDTSELSPDETAQQILLHLESEGFVGPRLG